MISISDSIQIVFAEFVADEVVHTLSSVVETEINSKFILGLIFRRLQYTIFWYSVWPLGKES